MTKEEFFQNNDKILSAEIYLTDNLDNLLNEMETNHWCLNIDPKTAKNIEKQELKDFLKNVIENRKSQLEKSSMNIDLVFYIWFDQFSGNLHFNLINSKHEKLPFDSELNFVDSIDKIIEKFLDSTYLDYLEKASWEELENNSNEKNNRLNIYKEIIEKTRKHNNI